MFVVEFKVVIFPVVPLNVTALDVVALVVEAFRVAKLAVVPNSVPMVAEVKLAIAAKKDERTFRLVIDEVETTRFEMFALVEVELVEVELITSIFEPENPGPVIVPVTARLVMVAFVIVEFEEVRNEVEAVRRLAESELVVDALVVEAEMFCEFSVEEFKVVIFPVVPLNVTALEVVAFVVEAFSIAKFPVVPKSVPIVAEVKLAIAAKSDESTFRFEIEEVAARI